MIEPMPVGAPDQLERTASRSPNVLISSAGRRNYLVGWFCDASRRFGGRTVAVDADPFAPSRADADVFAVVPPITHDEYVPALLQLCAQYDIGLALSANDHELSRWSGMSAAEFDELGTLLLALDPTAQQLAEDKLTMAGRLASAGVPVPLTTSAAVTGEPVGDVVVKARFGSGSNLLALASAADTRREAERLAALARDRLNNPILDRTAALEALVVQERKYGQEFGVDVINDFDGRFVGVLARRKIRMRHGETDQAETVPPDRFLGLGKQLSAAVGHRGLIDCDVIECADGSLWLIDVNPRFGGGYPFCHVAGADVPTLYLHWLTGTTPMDDHLLYRSGVVASKHVSVAVVAS